MICCWAIQAAVMGQQLLGLWHAPVLINDILLPEDAGRIAPQWDLVIYIVFIMVALAIGKIIFQFWRKPVNRWLLAFEGAVSFLMVSALFKLVIYDNSPQLAQRSLTALIVIATLSKIFYPECKKWVTDLCQRINMISWSPYANAWWLVVIVLMIYMPDLERVAAMIYMGECFHHFDFFIMASGWSSLCGQLPSVDVLGEYGVGLPVIFAKLIHAGGGFDYVPALRAMMFFVIGYFILVYFLVRYWLKSPLIAGVAFLLVFRLQMFHYGVSPLIWTVPSASVMRFGLDIVWMALLLQHMRSGRSRWLILAAIYSGFAPYYMTSSGLCVMVTFYAYLVALMIFPLLRRQWLRDAPKRISYIVCWVLPVLSAFIFLWMTLGVHLFQKAFWHNLLEYMFDFSRSGAMPMFESLKYRHFWAFVMSMVMPFTYIATFLYIAACLYLEKGPVEGPFVALLCIYGLANYQYYVVRSAITSYYVDVLSFILIVCFWFMHCLWFLPLIWQKRLKAAAVGLSFYALLTNQNYLAYPNLLSFSRNPMTDNLVIQRFPDRQGYFNNMNKNTKEQDKLPVNDLGNTEEDIRTEDDFKNDADLVSYYREHFDFSQDAALIQSLTKPGERVALISSFETKILIQADRAPFFYHFPLLTSRPMTLRSWPGEGVNTPGYLSETLQQLEQDRPGYIFMEKVFLQDSLPASYQENYGRVLAIIAYTKAHYQFMDQGKYLVVMKRKAEE